MSQNIENKTKFLKRQVCNFVCYRRVRTGTSNLTPEHSAKNSHVVSTFCLSVISKFCDFKYVHICYKQTTILCKVSMNGNSAVPRTSIISG
jgi:hypothetical protein